MDDFVGEDGELFMDPGALDSSPEQYDLGADRNRDRAPAPARAGTYGSASKPWKRLLIKGGSGVRHGDGREYLNERDSGLEDRGVDLERGGGPRKRKRSSGLTDQPGRGWGPEKHKEKMRMEGRRLGREEGRSSAGGKGFNGGDEEQGEGERDAIAVPGSEVCQGVRTTDDRHSHRHYAQVEEDKEHDIIDQLFESGRKKKNDRPHADVGLIIQEFMAEFKVACEDDERLIRESKPAHNKLSKLPVLIDVLSKKCLHKLFLDHGILTLLKKWLKPLPDGSMPSTNIRAAVLNILKDFQLDLEQFYRREQLKKSGLVKVIMFLSKSSEETDANRKLAKELIDKWSRTVKSTKFEDMRRFNDEKALYKPPQKKPTASSAGRELRKDHPDVDFSQRKSGQGGSRPEPSPLDFVMPRKSKLDPGKWSKTSAGRS